MYFEAAFSDQEMNTGGSQVKATKAQERDGRTMGRKAKKLGPDFNMRKRRADGKEFLPTHTYRLLAGQDEWQYGDTTYGPVFEQSKHNCCRLTILEFY